MFGKNKSKSHGRNSHIGFDFVYFTLDELKFLFRYGKAMLSLFEGTRKPSTENQSKFVAACRGKRPVSQYYEVIFLKFLVSGWTYSELVRLCTGQFRTEKYLENEYEQYRYGKNPPRDLDSDEL